MLTMLFQAFRDGNGEKRAYQGRASLEAYLLREFFAVFFCHVSEAGMDKRIREVSNTAEVEHDRFHPVPDTFNLERAELVSDVAVGEEFAEFGDHLEF